MLQHQDLVDIISQIPNSNQQPTRSLDDITILVVHHSATNWTDGGNIIATLTSEAAYQNNTSIPGSKGLQYHFVIANGNIYYCNGLEYWLWHAGDNIVNKHSLAVCVQGNYQTQTISDEDRQALDNLIWMLSTDATGDFQMLNNINTKDGVNLKVHGEIVPDACCGANLKLIVIDMRNTKFQSEIDYWNSKTPAQDPPIDPVQPVVDPLQSVVDGLNAQIADLKETNLQLTQENQTLTAQSQAQTLDFQAKLNTVNTSQASTVQELKNEQDKNTVLNQQIVQLQTQANAAKNNLDTVSKDLSTKSTKLSTVGQSVTVFLKKYEQSIKENTMLRETLTDASKQIYNLQTELDYHKMLLNLEGKGKSLIDGITILVKNFFKRS